MTIPECWGKLRGQRSAGIVLHDWKAIYIPIPKVACTSLKTVCAQVLSLKGAVHGRANFPEVQHGDIKQKHPDYFVFAFVRNPWDRLLSCFLSKIDPTLDDDGEVFRNGVEFNFWKYGDMFHGSMSFSAFVRATTSIPDEEGDIHFSSQYRHLTDSHGGLVTDFIGRFESLAVDFAAACERLKMPRMALPHEVKTDHGHYSQYYTRETQALVRERYPKDIELFGYRFENRSQQGL